MLYDLIAGSFSFVFWSLAVVLVVIVCRQILLWYFRIDDMVKRQDRIIELLEKADARQQKSGPLP